MKPTKRQLIDNSLFLYGGLVAFALTGIAFFNLHSTTSVITLILFLPVSLYFLVRFVLIIGSFFHNALNADQKRHPYFGSFTFGNFFNQAEFSFSLNLTLLALAVTLILFRISLSIIQ